jgi:hypothetical protein
MICGPQRGSVNRIDDRSNPGKCLTARAIAAPDLETDI